MGETSILGGGRVKKSSLRIECYGTVDELNAVLGVARSFNEHREIDAILVRFQNELFILGSDLAAPSENWKKEMHIPCIEEAHVSYIESLIDTYDKELPKLEKFVLPGGSKVASFLHQARTICRRAERYCVLLSEHEPVSKLCVTYLNRFSDLLFVLARVANYRLGNEESLWDSSKS